MSERRRRLLSRAELKRNIAQKSTRRRSGPVGALSTRGLSTRRGRSLAPRVARVLVVGDRIVLAAAVRPAELALALAGPCHRRVEITDVLVPISPRGLGTRRRAEARHVAPRAPQECA